MNYNKDLFSEFPSISSKQWKQKIQFDLKGIEYNTLLTNTLEGVHIKPFYHAESFQSLKIKENVKEFSICQSIFIHNEKKTNNLALDALNRGADSIYFTAEKTFDIHSVLNNIEDKEIFFKFLFLDLEFLKTLINSNKKNTLFINIDLVGNLAKTGNWFFSNQKDHAILKSILDLNNSNNHMLGVDVSLYQNAGANSVQQVAYALAHANEYLNLIDKNNISGVKKINFNFSIGSNYFFEIAKLRAFNYLWNKLAKVYSYKLEAHIFSKPTFRNKSIYDYNVNMLRSTTECMSAILGGTNTISNIAYDSIFHKKNEFGERIARNQLIILKEECKIKDSNVSDGTYFIEELTYEIATKALQIFKDIESNGGFIQQLMKGTIQRKISESAKKEQDLFDKDSINLLGVNKFPNLEDKMKNDIEIFPFLKKKKNKTVCIPIVEKRLSEKIEEERLKTEN